MRHMFYGSFGTYNSMKKFIFLFDPRKGQVQIKLDHISKFKYSFMTTPISCRVLSQDSKMSLFDSKQLEMPKIRFK